MLDADQAKLYELIWTRTIASQMESAELERTTVEIAASVNAGNYKRIDLRATGQVVRFDGFLALYQEGKDDEEDRGIRPLPADERRRPPRQGPHRGRPAFHRTAAALRRGDAGQADGRTRHRPPLDLCVDARRAARAPIRQDREEAPWRPRTRAVSLRPFWKAPCYVGYDFTDLGEKLDKVPNHEGDWKQLLRDFWAEFSALAGTR